MDNPREKYPDVYEYVISEENNYRTQKINLGSNWDWSMWEHVDKSFHLKNSQFTKGANDGTRPYNNIIIPIANVNYRSEGFDVKDIEVFVNDKENYYKSLLTRKYHIKWAKKYSIDTAIDESVESYFDFGLALVKNVNEQRPEVVPLQSLAFVDQTDILSGPICIKHQYSIDQLLEMKGTWYNEEIDKAIMMAKFGKTKDDNENKTPSKYIEVYELHGMFPDSWLNKDEDDYEDTGKYSRHIHILTYYIGSGGKKNGICLYKGKEKKQIFKVLKRDPIFGRACGRGGIEELFNPQIWTNYSEIHLHQMLEATSKVVMQTADKKLAKNNKFSNVKHGTTLTHEDGKPLTQVVVQPFNKVAFDNNVNKWEQIARTIGSSNDAQLGLNPTSGTPLGTTEIVTQQGLGIHEYRKGKIATFWGEIYRDWVLDTLARDMNNNNSWVDELTVEELMAVAENIATQEANQRVKDMILSGKPVSPQDMETMKMLIKDDFMKSGGKRFLEIMKGEISNVPLDVDFSIAGKQKNMAEVVNKLNAIFKTIFANPAILQLPGVGELFNDILESSGLNPMKFAALTVPQPQQSVQQEQPVAA